MWLGWVGRKGVVVAYQAECLNGKVAPDFVDKVAVVVVAAAAAVVVVAAAAVAVALIRAWLVEEVCPPDWWKQNCTARKVCTRSAMAV